MGLLTAVTVSRQFCTSIGCGAPFGVTFLFKKASFEFRKPHRGARLAKSIFLENKFFFKLVNLKKNDFEKKKKFRNLKY